MLLKIDKFLVKHYFFWEFIIYADSMRDSTYFMFYNLQIFTISPKWQTVGNSLNTVCLHAEKNTSPIVKLYTLLTAFFNEE